MVLEMGPGVGVGGEGGGFVVEMAAELDGCYDEGVDCYCAEHGSEYPEVVEP